MANPPFYLGIHLQTVHFPYFPLLFYFTGVYILWSPKLAKQPLFQSIYPKSRWRNTVERRRPGSPYLLRLAKQTLDFWGFGKLWRYGGVEGWRDGKNIPLKINGYFRWKCPFPRDPGSPCQRMSKGCTITSKMQLVPFWRTFLHLRGCTNISFSRWEGWGLEPSYSFSPLTTPKIDETPWMLQGGPLPVINGLIDPINCHVNGKKGLFHTTYSSYNPSYNW